MTVSLPRRRSRVVFWISAIAILSAIVATALLANDKRNLRMIAEHYRLSWLDQGALMPPPPPAPTKPAAPARPPATAVAMTQPKAERLIPPHLLAGLPNAPSAFLRRWKVSGKLLCSRIAEAGFAVSPWHQSDMDPATFECSYQSPASDNAAPEQPSLFFIVRGSAAGDVGNIRIKAILPETPAGDALKLKFQALFRAIVRQTQWRDMNDAADHIDRLENITQSAFGARLMFAHEFEDPKRFNLIIDLERPNEIQRTTATFFDRAKWLQLPARL